MMASSQALLVVDMQSDFCLSTSHLFVKGAPDCLPKVELAVEAARMHGVPVIWVVREHDASGNDVEANRASFFRDGKGGICVPGTPGAALVGSLQRREGDIWLVKKRFSAFLHTHAERLLRRMGVKRVVIVGVQTPNCVRGTAMDALSLDFEVTVLGDATASQTNQVQVANLFDMRYAGIETPSTAEWIAELKKLKPPQV